MLRALAFTLLAAAPAAQDQETNPEGPPGKVHTVARGSVAPVIKLDAVLEPARAARIRIRPKAYKGELKILKAVEQGGLVKKDDLLLEIDPKPFEKQLAAAERGLRVARAAFKAKRDGAALEEKSAAADLQKAEQALEDAETNLKIFKEVEGKHLLARTEQSVKFSEDTLENQQEELDQLLKMYKSEELTNETTEIVVKRARRALERAKKQLEMTRESAKVTREVRYPQRLRTVEEMVRTARLSLEKFRISQEHARVERKASLESAEEDFAKTEKSVAELRADRAQLTLRAPFAGRVFFGASQNGQWASALEMEQQLKPGKKVQAGMVLMTVCGMSLSAATNLPEKSFFNVEKGAEATVKPVSLPGVTLKGTVLSKAPVPGSTGGFPLKIDLKKSPLKLLPGMKAKVTIKEPETRDVVVVPVGAVAKSSVRIWKDGKAEPREVETGKSDGKMIEIKSGLEAGEEILLPKE